MRYRRGAEDSRVTESLLTDADQRLKEIRSRAERPIVYPVTRDEALWLLNLIDALRIDNERAYVAFQELTQGRP